MLVYLSDGMIGLTIKEDKKEINHLVIRYFYSFYANQFYFLKKDDRGVC